MKTYQDLLQHVLDMNADAIESDAARPDRTGTGTYSVFGTQSRYDLNKGFPLVTTKKVRFDLIVSELLWFLRGDTNIRFLLEHNNHIWDEWTFERYIQSSAYTGPDLTDFGRRSQRDIVFREIYRNELAQFRKRVLADEAFAKRHGDLGPVYGHQWRHWDGHVDQIRWLVEEILRNPASRRLVLTGWNPTDVYSGRMALPPCHTLFQLYVKDGRLSGQLYQRSGDLFLGVPFNIASYALLLHILASWTGLAVGEFVHTIGDAHIYQNHLDQVKEQLGREPRPLPTLAFGDIGTLDDIDQLTPDHFTLEGYDPHPRISAPVAV